LYRPSCFPQLSGDCRLKPAGDALYAHRMTARRRLDVHEPFRWPCTFQERVVHGPPDRIGEAHRRMRYREPNEVTPMNQDTIQGQWKQLSGQIKEHWGKLTDDDLKVAQGSAEYLAGRVQERYGIARDAADRQVKEFAKALRNVH
jgi:uncharacterized protein YjbJ (UPF0337 family)